MFELYSEWWFAYNLAFVYAMARLEIDDTPTSVARRDVTAFFSPQDCINFLRFTRPQVCGWKRALGPAAASVCVRARLVYLSLKQLWCVCACVCVRACVCVVWSHP